MPSGPMKRSLFFAVASSLLITASVQAANKTFLIGSFDELLVEGDMQVILDNTKSPSAKASGDHNLIEALKIDRNGLTVRIRIQDYEGKTQAAPVTQPLVIRLGGRGVTKVSVDGAATVSVNKISIAGGPASLKVSGPGSISVGTVASDRLSVSMAGSGTVAVDGGKVRAGQFGINGSGTLKAPLLSFQQAKLSQSGNANSHLLVEQEIEITNSGAGVIRIDGKATCFVRQPGSARITCNKAPLK